MKKIICLICTISLVIGSASVVSAKAWSTYFGLNKGWYEGTKGSLTSNSANGWSAKIQSIGWGGCWGGQVYQKASIQKGKTYKIQFTIKSSKLDKWVFLKIGDDRGKQMNLGKWIDCRKGQTVSVNETFTAKYNGKSVYFGIGGDFHDRQGVKTDHDAKVRYKYAPNKKLDGRLGPDAAADHPTVITCTNFSLLSEGSIGKSVLNKTKAIMDKKEKLKLKVRNSNSKVKWKSSNKKIATVNKKGVVKSKKYGKVMISAKVGNTTYRCRIIVKKVKYVAKYNKHHIKIIAKHDTRNKTTRIKIKNKNSNNDIYLGRNWGSDAIFYLKTSKKTYTKQVDYLDDEYNFKPSYQDIGPGITFKYHIKGKGRPKSLKVNGIMPLNKRGLPINDKKYIIKIKYK